MDIHHETAWIHRLDQPVFCVREGRIEDANHAARGRLVPIGEPVEPLLVTGKREYRDLQEGWLYLTATIQETTYKVTVQKIGQWDIFTLEPEEISGELRVLSLASQKLRTPLGGLFATVEHLSDSISGEENEKSLALIRRNLYQILRQVQNMDAGTRCLQEPPRLELWDVTVLVREIFEKLDQYCREAGCVLSYTGPAAPAYSLVDPVQLEDTINKILSNSLCHGAKGTITAKLTRRSNTLYLTVQDPPGETAPEFGGNIFTQYLREPVYEPGQAGLGLGLSIISAFASSHGGTVLLEPKKKGMRLTLSLPMRQEELVRTPTLRPDLTGGQDIALVELSELLPWELYGPGRK